MANTVKSQIEKSIANATRLYNFKGNDEILLTSDAFCDANKIIKEVRAEMVELLEKKNPALLPDELKLVACFTDVEHKATKTKPAYIERVLAPRSCCTKELVEVYLTKWFNRVVFERFYKEHHANLNSMVNKDGKEIKMGKTILDGRNKERLIKSYCQKLNAQRCKDLAKLKEAFVDEWEAIKNARKQAKAK